MVATNNFVPSKGGAIAQCKCPRCRSGNLFSNKAFDLKNFIKTNHRCPVCDLQFEVEPGFWWGAMYVSYAITVALCIALSIATYVLVGDPPLMTYAAIVISSIVILSPFIFRYSRVLMIYFFASIEFHPELANKKGNS